MFYDSNMKKYISDQRILRKKNCPSINSSWTVICDAFTHKERSDCNKLLHSEHRHICKTVLSGMVWLCQQIIRNVRSNPIPGEEISNHVKQPWTWIFGGPWGGRVCSTLLGTDKHSLSLFWSPQKSETRPHESGITTHLLAECAVGAVTSPSCWGHSRSGLWVEQRTALAPHIAVSGD